jgi:recombination protein RecT
MSKTAVKTALAEKAAGQTNKPMTPEQTIRHYLQKMTPEIQRALPKHLDADRLTRIALTTIRQTPKLLDCNIQSLLAAVMQSAQLGLEPNILGQAYIIPYGKEAQFIIGYRGMIDLARRSGHIESIYAHPVYDQDEFDYEYGLNPKLRHKPAMGDRGKFIGAYGVAKFKDGGYHFEFMPKSEIDKRRGRSKAKNSGPWVTDYEEMACKTVIRHMFKYLPISIEIMKQVENTDETIKTELREDMTESPDISENIIDVDYEEAPPESPAPKEDAWSEDDFPEELRLE